MIERAEVKQPTLKCNAPAFDAGLYPALFLRLILPNQF